MCSSPSPPVTGKRLTLVATGLANEGNIKTTSTKAATDTKPPGPELDSPSTPVLPVSPTAAYRIAASILGNPVSLILDTGAAVTILHKRAWDRVKSPSATLIPWTGRNLVSVEGSSLTVLGSTKLPLQLGTTVFSAEIVIADGLTTEGILGLDFLESHRCTIDTYHRVLQCNDPKTTVPLCSRTEPTSWTSCAVVISESIRIPPFSELEVMAQTERAPDEQPYLLEPVISPQSPIRAARALVSPSTTSVPIRLVNSSMEPVTIHKGKKVGQLEPVNDITICPITEGIADSPNTAATPLSPEKEQLLWSMVHSAESNLTERESEKLFELLTLHADVFADSKDDVGQTDVTQHQIHTGEARPIHQPPRRLAAGQKQEVRELLQKMQDRGIIRPSSSPWASPIVLVRKSNGSLRFCVDYRKINKVTRKDAYPLPRIDDALDTLSGCRWFTTLDLISGYWQVQLHPDDREKSAFTTFDGLYEFNVMPFGLCNAPATFQRLMDCVLAGLQWTSCLVYIDDIVIPGKTFDDHLINLHSVLIRLREANLKLQPPKCIFARKSVNFLGHIISAEGIATDPGKIDKVTTWPTPTCRRDVQQFLGLCNYYRRFIKDFAVIAKPLHRLTEKATTFCWNENCQLAFEKLRQELTSTPVLAFPDYSRPFLLDTDASDSGIGAVLSQVQDDGRERVIGYASRMLSKPERRYCTTRKELLSVVAFTKHFQPYLLCRHFTLRTDHGSLQWLYNFKEPEGQLARWLEQLQEYDFTIVHRQGKKHVNADALSRLQDSHQQDNPEGLVGSTQQGTGEELPEVEESIEDSTSVAQRKDPAIAPILAAKQKGILPDPNTVASWGREGQILMHQWEQLEVHDGVLWRRFHHSEGTHSHLQLVVPASLRREILQTTHGGAVGGHLGQRKTLSQIRHNFYWPGQTTDVKNWCRTCAVCAVRKNPVPRPRAGLQTIPTGYPMQVVAVDILGPLPEMPSGNKYILVAADYFTRWTEAYGIPNQEAGTVAAKLVDEMFLRFSPPSQLHSDQGPQFESSLMAEVCKLLGIVKTRTTPYHPQGDGLVERFNRTLLGMLATCAQQHPTSWELHLQKVCFAYNSSEHPSTGYSPFFLMFGREARLPAELMFGPSPTDKLPPHQYAKDLQSLLCSAYEKVRNHLEAAHKHQKVLYDRRVHGKRYEVGDFVWLLRPQVPKGHSRKLYCPWDGPHLVLARLSDANYRIRSLRGRSVTQIVHFNRLKPCPADVRLENQNQPPRPTQPPPQQLGDNLVLPDYGADPQAPQPPPPPRYPCRTRHPPDRLGH